MLEATAVYDAAHSLYSLEFANVAEERGAPLRQCDLFETVERLPESVAAPHIWRIIGRIENALGASLDLLFHHAGLSGSDQSRALSALVLGCAGHGVAITDDFEIPWKRACEVLRVQYKSAPIHFEGCEWRELAEWEIDKQQKRGRFGAGVNNR